MIFIGDTFTLNVRRVETPWPSLTMRSNWYRPATLGAPTIAALPGTKFNRLVAFATRSRSPGGSTAPGASAHV